MLDHFQNFSETFATSFALSSAADARRERKLAEDRFHDVQELANKVLFDYPIALRRIDSSTDLQLQMANDSLQYLDNLFARQDFRHRNAPESRQRLHSNWHFSWHTADGKSGPPGKGHRDLCQGTSDPGGSAPPKAKSAGRAAGIRQDAAPDEPTRQGECVRTASRSLHLFEDLYRQQRGDDILLLSGGHISDWQN